MRLIKANVYPSEIFKSLPIPFAYFSPCALSPSVLIIATQLNVASTANTQRARSLQMFWLIFAAGAVIATVHPESREKVKDVPWMSLAVAIGLAALGDGIQDGLRNVAKTV